MAVNTMVQTRPGIRVVARVGGVCLLTLALLWGCADPKERLQRHQLDGKRYLAAGKVREAVIEYRNAVQLAPNSGEDHLHLGQALLQLGTVDDIRSAFKEFTLAVQHDPELLQAQLEVGKLLQLSGDLDGAREKAELILDRVPAHKQGRLLLAQALAGQKETERSLKLFGQLAKDYPEWIQVHLGWAQVLTSVGRPKEAEAALRNAIALDPKALAAPMLLSSMLVAQQRRADAISVLDTLIAEVPEATLAYIQRARIQMLDGDAAGARETLKALVAVRPNEAVSYLALGRLLEQLRDRDGALAVYTDGVDKAVEATDLRIKLAEMQIVDGDFDAVETQAKALLKGDSGLVSGRILTGLVAMGRGQTELAIQTFSRVLKDQPGHALAEYYLARAYARSGDLVTAQARYQAALDTNKDLLVARVALTELLLQKGELEGAKIEVERLRALAPNFPDTLLLSGMVATAERKYGAAQAYFKQVLKVVPDLAEGHYQLGRVLLIQQKVAAARKEIERAYVLEPERDRALALLVQMDMADKRPSSAKKRLIAATVAYPDRPVPFDLLGQLLVRTGDLAGAQAAFEKAIALDPSFAPAYAALGQLAVKSGDLDGAIERFKAAVAKNPDHVGARMLLGVVYEQKGDDAAAIDTYKSLLERTPNFVPAANNLAWLYVNSGGDDTGNVDVAMGLAQTAREYAPDDPSVADTLGWIYYTRGAYLKAEGLLAEALESLGDSPEVLYHAGMISARQGHTALAKQRLKRAIKLGLDGAAQTEAQNTLATLG